VLRELHDVGVTAPVVVGGIIPDADQPDLIAAGVAAVYTPKDYSVGRIMDDIVNIVERHRATNN
jgi:(2R)-ethylmalonyl-CoA mutase